MTAASPGVLSKKSKETTGGPGGKEVQDPVDDFVHMEYALAGNICTAVDSSIMALRKVEFLDEFIYTFIDLGS